MRAVAELLAEATRELAAAGVEAPRREARLLLEAAAGLSRTRIIAEPERQMTEEQETRFHFLVSERRVRKPMAYIRGTQEFYGLEFEVGHGVLVPRPETELIIDLALRILPDRDALLRILDLGVGSGCLLLTLLHHFPHARGVGLDISADALDWAKLNTTRLQLAERVRLQPGYWCEGIEQRFDLVVANPPYVRSFEIRALAPEVGRHEPGLALDGGHTGLTAYEEIAQGLAEVLAPAALALLECGMDQAEPLDVLFTTAGFTVRRHRDLAGIERVLELRRAGEN